MSDTLPVDPGAPLPPAPEPRASYGPYTVVRELGQGGMGVVYLADEPRLRRQVALKVLPYGLAASVEHRARFLREAEMASRLDHPNICGVYGAGETDGALWLAMRYVPGRTLKDLLVEAAARAEAAGDCGVALGSADDPIPWRRTALLVETLARAVHAAHEAGIVHCDLKPANVMVTPEGAPVVLDFGVAHDLRGGDGLALTRTGQVLGTPHYLPPEQILAQGERRDPRLDVWSLGVMLYEMLALRRPFDGPSVEGLFRRILQDEPPSLTSCRLGPPKDLRTVVETALQKDPARRYPSALALAEDLRAVVERRPIRARAIGPIGRLTRFARRRPAAATLAALLVLGVPPVTGLLVASRIHARRITAAIEHRLEDARAAVAAQSPSAARAALAAAAELCPEFDPRVAALQRGIARLEEYLQAEALALDPESDPDGRLARALLEPLARGRPDELEPTALLACVLRRTGAGADATSLLDAFEARHPGRGAATLRAALAGAPVQVAGAGGRLGLFLALALSAHGRHAEALAALERLLERDPSAHWIAWAAAEEATRLQDSHAALALAGRHRLAGGLGSRVRRGRYSVHLRRAGLLDEAARVAEEALAAPSMAPAGSRARRQEEALVRMHLANVRAEQRRFAEARALLDEALTLEADFPEAWNALGVLCGDERDEDGAVAACRRCVALAPNHPEGWLNLGNALLRAGRANDALEALHRAVTLRPDFPFAWNALASAYSDLERYDDARAAAERALALKPGYSDPLANLGVMEQRQGRFEAAERLYRDALALAPAAPATLYNLALLVEERDPAEAADLYRRALEQVPDDPAVHANLANVLATLGRADEGLPLARRACELAPEHPVQWNVLGTTLVAAGRMAEAIAPFREAARLDPTDALPAVNLMVVLSETEPGEALAWALDAARLDPELAPRLQANVEQLTERILSGQGEDAVSLAVRSANGEDGVRPVLLDQALTALGELAAAPSARREDVLHRAALEFLRPLAKTTADGSLRERIEAAAARLPTRR